MLPFNATVGRNNQNWEASEPTVYRCAAVQVSGHQLLRFIFCGVAESFCRELVQFQTVRLHRSACFQLHIAVPLFVALCRYHGAIRAHSLNVTCRQQRE